MFATAMFSKLALAGAAAGLIASALLPSAASAQEVQHRFNDQQARINQGVRSGQLTRGEYYRDESRLRSDERERNRDLRRDGTGRLTPGQSQRLNAQLDRNSSRVYDTKHDGRAR